MNELSEKEIAKQRQAQQQQEDKLDGNGDLDKDFIAYERRRRKWFFRVILGVSVLIAVLYGVFIKWIFVHIDGEIENYTGVATPFLLAAVPTMLTIFVLKLISKSERDGSVVTNEPLANVPVIEFIRQISEAIRGK